MPFIPLEVFANNPSTTVSSGGTGAPAAGTSENWTVASSSSFPAVEIGAQQFHVADPAQPGEVITVTNITGTSWTVTRGAENSTPVAHASGFTVTQVVTAGALAALQYPPWQFPVQAYGAQGDGKIGTGGTGTSGTATFTDSGASFVNATAPAGDVGKVIIINQGAGSATAPTNAYTGTITAVNSATSVTLSANLAANCSAAPYIYGTDDAAAITSAVTAAANWAVSTGNYKAQVMFEPQNYMLGALTQTTAFNWSFNSGPYTYNTHVPVPFAGASGRKLIIDFIGVGDASEPDFWGSAVPNIQGTCLVSAVFAASQPDATFGQQSVLGTPSVQTNIGNGGITGANFANTLVNINGISIVTPYNAQQYSFDFRFAAQANVTNGAALCFAPINFPAAAVGGTWLRQTSIPNNGVAVGLAMPVANNNDNCNIGLFSAEGIAIGFTVSEHFNATRIANLYCHAGLADQAPDGGKAIHGGAIQYWSCEGCDYGISWSGSQGAYTLNILNADFEVINTAYVNDPNNSLNGYMFYDDLASGPSAGAGVIGAQCYKIINTRFPPGLWAQNTGAPGIPAPPAAPASGTASTNAQQNTAWRDATIYLSATTGITAVFTGPASTGLTTTGLTAASAATVPVRVPSGQWYAVTYTGTLTTKWWLD